MPKGVKLGPRATVLFKSGSGQGAGAKSSYVYMLKSVAGKLGLETTKEPPTREVTRGKKKTKISLRGSFGAKRIKVPTSSQGSNSAAGRNGAKQKYVSVPVPADATIADIVAFLKKAKNKPKFFVSPHGRTYSLE